jgi:hypothetical protein
MIVKLSRSGSVVLFISDDGIVYSAPKGLVFKLLNGGIVSGWFCPGMLSGRVSMERFPRSKLFVPNGMVLDLFADDVPSSARSDGLNIMRQSTSDVAVADVVL